MTQEYHNLEDLAEQFDYDPQTYDISDIPSPIVDAMEYIDGNTGLLGDYNSGIVRLAEGGQTIQWYARGTYFSDHNTLLHWIQQSDLPIMLAIVGDRTHPDTGEKVPYAELHEQSRWGYDADTEEDQ